ncbi:CDP-glycerol glycerophosphotransferase family protein [Reichenbachiella carrageenanivorans]|uniref:CDP-glycerol glycerophosphotransferase family protein n=1 Tax=Reichenbachiella carrageenanivorans TaxID=2979869 RepID=A0ABY6CWQ9_9BACT|nr:CDP-glycerol glycerophosphotransferase family protein [Reichenbachiella carrageenanivorans]UXX78351.1 CDP-glycerol glycerophosphotransferase family protein [Reichenbachiella carrageenanivorans]
MFKKLLKVYGWLLRFIQIMVCAFYKKRKNHIILGSSAGTNVNGNSKALFLYMLNENTPLKGYFITRNYAAYKTHKKDYPDHFLYAYSWRALIKAISAKAFILTHGPYDVTPFKCVNTEKALVNVWHGFPIKKLGIDSHFLTKKQKRKALGDFDGFVVMSEEEKHIMSKCYQTKLENMWVTGYPRNDFTYVKNEKIIDLIPYTRSKKVLLYAPTFRDSGKTELFPFKDFNIDELINFLSANNTVILLRIHKNELSKHHLEESEWLKVCDGDVIQEVNEIMSIVDLLITDYSSSYIDRLLIDTPTLFVPYDLEWFSEYRGFNFDFNTVTPGAKVFDFKSFLENIKRYLDDPTLDSESRQQIKARFHKYPDNQSSRRVYEQIETLVYSKFSHL